MGGARTWRLSFTRPTPGSVSDFSRCPETLALSASCSVAGFDLSSTTYLLGTIAAALPLKFCLSQLHIGCVTRCVVCLSQSRVATWCSILGSFLQQCKASRVQGEPHLRQNQVIIWVNTLQQVLHCDLTWICTSMFSRSLLHLFPLILIKDAIYAGFARAQWRPDLNLTVRTARRNHVFFSVANHAGNMRVRYESDPSFRLFG